MIEYTYDSNAIEESTLTLEETALKKKKRIYKYLLFQRNETRFNKLM